MGDNGWAPTYPVKGNQQHIRLTATSIGSYEQACREKLAFKARPQVNVVRPYDPSMNGRSAPYRTFSLAIITEALELLDDQPDLISADADPLQAASRVVDAVLLKGKSAHAGARTWAVHALTSYFEVDEELRDEFPELTRLNSRAVVIGAGQTQREIDAWGVWYVDAGAGLVELRLLRPGSVETARPRDPAYLATAARVAAEGVPVDKRGWGDPYVPLAPHPTSVRRVRIVDIGLTDASVDVLFDDTPETAQVAFAQQAAPRLNLITAGGAYAPGRDCDGCQVVTACEAVPAVPGLLGVVGLATHRRYLTHSCLRDYEFCPARYWLTDEAGVPREQREYSTAARRGLLVHAALEWLHAREPRVACSASDLESDDALPAVALAVGALAEEWREVVVYLTAHIACCPLSDEVVSVRSEPTMVAFDPEADVIVSARPDLVYATETAVVWRETKTMPSLPLDDEAHLLEQFPQIALGLVLVAAGVVSDQPRNEVNDDVASGVVELEVLTPIGERLVRYSTTDPHVLHRARVLVASRVDPWLRDTAFEPQPGAQCAWCPVQLWCQPDVATRGDRAAVAMVIDGYRVDPETGEILPADDTAHGAPAESNRPSPSVPAPSARVRSLADSILGAAVDDSDEVPF